MNTHLVENHTHPISEVRPWLWVMWVVWLPFIIPSFLDLFSVQRPALKLILSLGGAVLFIALYLAAAWYIARYLLTTNPANTRRTTITWSFIAALTLLSFVLSLYDGEHWQNLFIFSIAIAGGLLYDWRVVLVVCLFVALTLLSGTLAAASWNTTRATLLLVSTVGATSTLIIRYAIVHRQLRQMREELVARLAVSDERLRIARDLHDLLGHNLSLIALKSELARRLVETAPERAISEIREVEAVAREALREVRETISGYRQPTLASELAAAQEILSAAGISCTCEVLPVTVPVTLEAVLAWTVREGATNIIRHSRATACSIQVTQDEQQVSVNVTDNGTGRKESAANPANDGYARLSQRPGTSSGLKGLSERVAAYGGVLEAASLPAGGFRLLVTLPLTAPVTLQAAQ